MKHLAGAALCLALVACSGKQGATKTKASAPPTAAAPAAAGARVPAAPSEGAPAGTQPEAEEGEDFAPEVAALYRVAACGGAAAVPATIDAKMVDAHCAALKGFYQRYTKRWISKAMPVLAQIVPAGIPDHVVYPFGGGDLMTALATFPDAVEITTISLEFAGDVRAIDTLEAKALADSLDTNRENLRRLMAVAHSKTTNLTIIDRGQLPGQLVFSLAALALHGYEPLSLRYFRIEDDGKLHYLTADEITAAEAEVAADKKGNKKRQELEIFADAEIRFRKAGDDKAPVKVFRHIAANLDDQHLAKNPGLLKHLQGKGKVTAMTKAASFLLWFQDFSTIRQYLLDNMEWMISDATGILPSAAKAAGFEQETWGRFDGPFLPGAGKKGTNEMKKLWQGNPQKALPFHYGYPDNAHHAHLMVTRRPKP